MTYVLAVAHWLVSGSCELYMVGGMSVALAITIQSIEEGWG